MHALAFTLRPVKQSIAALESQSCTLADCFLGLAKLGAAIKKLSNDNHRTFRQQCISIFNCRYAKFADPIYLLCFFLHPSYPGKCGYYLYSKLYNSFFLKKISNNDSNNVL